MMIQSNGTIVGQPTTAIQIPCCLCGTMIIPNSANQCGACLAQQFDLTVCIMYILTCC